MEISKYPTLYHYTGGQGLMGILGNQSIWATSIHSLNDTEEFAHALRLCKAALTKEIAKHSHPQGNVLLNALMGRLDGYSGLSVFVCCFSTVQDSLSQWRGYCPPAFGYSIGFNGEKLKERAESQGFRLEKCIYESRYKNDIVEKWASRWVPLLLENLMYGVDIEHHLNSRPLGYMREFGNFAPRLKHEAFEDEREWRLIADIDTNAPELAIRAGRSMLIRYFPIDLRGDAASSPFLSICVGPTPHMRLAAGAVSHYVRRVPGLKEIRHSAIPYRDW